ncbi:MAG: GNAT family N-acetyltransferase [Aestuariibacter sp.]
MLETERLTLRKFTLADVTAFMALGSHPDIIRYTGRTAIKSLADAEIAMRSSVLKDYQQNGLGRLACVCKESGKIIGFAGLKYVAQLGEVDIGYRFFPEYWGQGLATEVSQLLLHYGRETLKLERIVGIVDTKNQASVRVLEKLGMVFEKTVRLDFSPDDLALYV